MFCDMTQRNFIDGPPFLGDLSDGRFHLCPRKASDGKGKLGTVYRGHLQDLGNLLRKKCDQD